MRQATQVNIILHKGSIFLYFRFFMISLLFNFSLYAMFSPTVQTFPRVFFHEFNKNSHQRNKEDNSHDPKEIAADHCRNKRIQWR